MIVLTSPEPSLTSSLAPRHTSVDICTYSTLVTGRKREDGAGERRREHRYGRGHIILDCPILHRWNKHHR
eukprot:18130-Eustigmatos_ZCMA.PRE.1